LSGKRNPEYEKMYMKYYEVKKTPVKGVSLNPKQEAMDEAKKNYGYFSLISNGVKDPLDAIEIYLLILSNAFTSFHTVEREPS
jgi:hypothetical protein